MSIVSAQIRHKDSTAFGDLDLFRFFQFREQTVWYELR